MKNPSAITVENGYAYVLSDNGLTIFDINLPDLDLPTASSLSPAAAANGLSLNGNLAITFNEAISKGNGDLTIYGDNGSTLLETIDVNSDLVTINGTVATIDRRTISPVP